MRLRFALGALGAIACFHIFALQAAAQQPYTTKAVTAEDYARAERYLAPAAAGLTTGGTVAANWLPDERFWYRNQTSTSVEVILIDPVKKTRTVCDATMSNCPGVPATAAAAPGGGGGRGGPPGGGGGRGGRGGTNAGPPLTMSPDGKQGAFIRDWNLWVRDIATSTDRQLTTDGSKYFGYATDNAGWTRSDRAILLWSPDSRKIATQQQDERNVREWHMTNVRVGQPDLQSWPYPLPGDSVVAMLHRVIIEVETGKMVRLKLKPEYHRATLGDDISMGDYKWSPDGAKLALASTSRDHKVTTIRVADALTGDVRDVMTESVSTQFESRTGWNVLWATNELLWYSQKDDWGQLYLHDLNTGALKNTVTMGEGPVTQIVRLDEKTRTVWYMANGRMPGQDPYFAHAYRTGFDKGPQVALTPDDGMHTIQLSPMGKWIVDTYSKPDVPPVVALRDATGKLVMPLEKMDITRLVAAGWKAPIPIAVKADDGKTDVYGMMFVPTNLDRTKKYPIVNNAYPGPQSGSVGSRAFSAVRGDRQALAELGFIVVTIDGRGTPGRSKSFHDHYYGKMGRDNTLPDQVAGMKDLARQYPFIDLDRASMWGHSGGGFITAGAMFHYPDFFKVGIAESGNHDQRLYEDDWGERYQGLLERMPDGRDSYAIEANQEYAKNLKGKLLLAHGTLDTNVPPENTMLVADALIKANKDFDLLMFPNAGHGYGAASNYMMRRRWDYFVQHLLGAEPPKNYEIGRRVTP